MIDFKGNCAKCGNKIAYEGPCESELLLRALYDVEDRSVFIEIEKPWIDASEDMPASLLKPLLNEIDRQFKDGFILFDRKDYGLVAGGKIEKFKVALFFHKVSKRIERQSPTIEDSLKLAGIDPKAFPPKAKGLVWWRCLLLPAAVPCITFFWAIFWVFGVYEDVLGTPMDAFRAWARGE